MNGVKQASEVILVMSLALLFSGKAMILVLYVTYSSLKGGSLSQKKCIMLGTVYNVADGGFIQAVTF